MSFFNANFGSKIQELPTLPFAFLETKPVTIKSVLNDDVSGNFTVQGEIKWKQEKKVVEVGAARNPRCVRDAILADETANICISIWGDLIDNIEEYTPIAITNVVCQFYNGRKLSTTADSAVSHLQNAINNIDWEEVKTANSLEVLSCPEIDCVHCHSFHICCNLDCKKKVVPFPGQASVTCSTCKRKMLLARCKETYTCEFILCATDDNKQFKLTAFPNTIDEFLPTKENDRESLEDTLLQLKNIDFEFNANHVITKISYHKIDEEVKQVVSNEDKVLAKEVALSDNSDADVDTKQKTE
eukprot:gene13274-14642_t